MNDQNTQSLDPTVVNMARAIKSVETPGHTDPYTAKGQSGEYGAYQYTPLTWAADSHKYLGQEVPLENASVEQQNKVAYGKIKDLKDQGYNPLQVAQIWNHGSVDPTNSAVGTNSSGVSYDTPTYSKHVITAYNQLKGGIQPETPVSTNIPEEPQDQTLTQELGDRMQSASQSLSDASSGKQHLASGILQAVGQGAGAIGDITNKAIELIPGAKWLEKELGQGVSALAQTPIGQSVVNTMQDFAKNHPEIAKDIGAGFNIVTAIPILKGLGVIKDVAMSGVSQALKGIAEKGFAKETGEILQKTVGGRKLITKDTQDIIQKGILEPRNLPNISNGKYVTDEAIAKADEQIKNISETELQPVLDMNNTPQVSQRTPLASLRDQAIQEAKDKLQNTKPIEDMFDRIKEKFGDYPTLSELNQAKRLVSEQVPNQAFNLEGYNANYTVRQTLQHSIEDGAEKLGLDDVKAINQKMRVLYQAQDILQKMNGQKVKSGLISKIARKGISVGAGMIAEKMGAGVVGSLGTGILADVADKGINSSGSVFRNAVLNRTGENAIKVPLSKVLKRSAGLLGAIGAQKSIK